MSLRAILVTAVLATTVAATPRTGSAVEGRANAQGVWIHYRVTGRGAPVVLIHGLYSSAREDWDLAGISADLARTHEVVTLDLAGHGESDRPARPDAYGVALVDDVLAVMDALHLSRARIVGNSEGGLVALKLAADHPDRVQSLAVIGAGWLAPGRAFPDTWDLEPGRTRGETPPVVAATIGHLALTEGDLRRIRAPAIVIIGDRDPVNAAFVAPLRRVRSDWPVIVIPGARHLDDLTRPLVARTLAEWLASH